MDLSSSSSDQLRHDLAALQRNGAGSHAAQVDELERTIQELQVHRIELEMQNRALQETQGELEHTLRRYADLYDHLPLGYLTVAASGEILEANLTAATWLGVDRPQLRGMLVSRFLNPFDAGRFAVHLELCLHSGAEKTFDAALRLESGVTVPVQISSRPAPRARDTLPQVLCAITNVSQLRQSQQMASELKRDQDVFGDSISHDLRSPLITIGTYVRIVLSEHGAVLPAEAKSMLERVDRAAHRMEATLKQLLAYNVLLRDDVTLETLSLDETVQGLVVEYRSQIEAAQGHVTVARPLPPVVGCARLLGPALGNVLSNALKFTKPGEAPRVTISSEDRGSVVLIRIADQGIGIDPQHHQRIFQVFDRLHSHVDYPGSGIGLAIVKRAVERMRGQVGVESEKGKGSCFHILLPRG